MTCWPLSPWLSVCKSGCQPYLLSLYLCLGMAWGVCFFDHVSVYDFVSLCQSSCHCLFSSASLSICLCLPVSMHVLHFLCSWDILSFSFSVAFWSLERHWPVRWPWHDKSCKWRPFCIYAFQAFVFVTWIMRMNVFRSPPWPHRHGDSSALKWNPVQGCVCVLNFVLSNPCYDKLVLKESIAIAKFGNTILL